ncbi:hypothetical protein EVAR_59825_1 [Eumeta japonica]|uniref:Uncharacterized protein n=1 Tax=Eumeta variegata TaxID=151549 RepID=A0A4C1Z8D6_EUMVA|nr:hypothetical protein EVAR_59825_1 [Eumeta japonica]
MQQHRNEPGHVMILNVGIGCVKTRRRLYVFIFVNRDTSDHTEREDTCRGRSEKQIKSKRRVIARLPARTTAPYVNLDDPSRKISRRLHSRRRRGAR